MAHSIPKGLGNVKELLKRYDKANARWELWRSLHQECFDFSAPERETFRFRSPGQSKNRHIFDSTAVTGLTQFASRIQGSLVPSWLNWMNFVAGDEIPKEDKDKITEGLEKATDIFFTHLNHSNFSTEITPSFSDLGIGTGAILVEEAPFTDDVVLSFTNVPLAELYPEVPARGSVKNVWRMQSVEPKNILQTWPNATLPSKLKVLVDKRSQDNVDIITGMLFNPDDALSTKTKSGKPEPYHQIVIFEKSVIFTQSFTEKRLIVFRWHVTPGEVFGRGPIMQVLPDIRTVNKVKQFVLDNAALQMSGVFTGVSDGVFNPYTVTILPGSIIPVSNNGTVNPTLAPLPLSGNIRIGELVIIDLQNTIRKTLLVDPLGELTDPVRTATEMLIRNQETLKLQGASIGRLKSELIEPLVNAVVGILTSRNKLPQFKVDGREVTIKQQSPLAKAEDIEDFQNSQLWFSNISELPPELVGGVVKVEDLPRFWAEKLGVPASLLRDKTEQTRLATALIGAAETSITGGAIEPGE